MKKQSRQVRELWQIAGTPDPNTPTLDALCSAILPAFDCNLENYVIINFALCNSFNFQFRNPTFQLDTCFPLLNSICFTNSFSQIVISPFHLWDLNGNIIWMYNYTHTWYKKQKVFSIQNPFSPRIVWPRGWIHGTSRNSWRRLKSNFQQFLSPAFWCSPVLLAVYYRGHDFSYWVKVV